MAPWVLRLLGDTPVRLLVSPGRIFRIGRDTEADLCLDDKLVSRRHAELEVLADGTLELRDLGSRNGTKVAGKPLHGKIRLRETDEVRIGSATIIVDGPQEAASGTTRKHAAPVTSDEPASSSEAMQSALSPDVRSSVPGYELLNEIARGRTGIIYRARSDPGEQVFLKLLDPSWASSENALARFEAEAQAIAAIDHPNIVRLIDISATATRHYYTMEWLEGHTLEKMIRRGPVPPRDAIAIAVQVARGLSVAHTLGTVHRDVAPASIFVTPDGVAKVFDFAFVKPQGDNLPSLTNIGDVVGDLRYCSPEQAGNPRAVDHRSDLYSLGATLYHAISGKPPIEGKNYLDTYQRIVKDVPQALNDLVPDVRPRLAQTVSRLLEKDMERRFKDGTEVAQALAESLLEAVIAARSAPPPPGTGVGADFHGVELIEFIEVLAVRKATGVLTVASSGGEGDIRFRSGEIVGARAVAETRTRESVDALLDLKFGTFGFKSTPYIQPGAEDEAPLKAADIALEALKRRSSGGSRQVSPLPRGEG